MSPFSFILAMPVVGERKPKPKPKANQGYQAPKNRHLVAQVIREVARGSMVKDAVARLGFSSGWFSAQLREMPETDPLRVKYHAAISKAKAKRLKAQMKKREQAKPEEEAPRVCRITENRRNGKRPNLGEERLALLEKGIKYIKEGASAAEAAQRLGFSRSWLTQAMGQFDKKDPMRRRYRAALRHSQNCTETRAKVVRVLEIMERREMYAQYAADEIEWPAHCFFTWMKTHKRDPLYRRYKKIQSTLKDWRIKQ